MINKDTPKANRGNMLNKASVSNNMHNKDMASSRCTGCSQGCSKGIPSSGCNSSRDMGSRHMGSRHMASSSTARINMASRRLSKLSKVRNGGKEEKVEGRIKERIKVAPVQVIVVVAKAKNHNVAKQAAKLLGARLRELPRKQQSQQAR